MSLGLWNLQWLNHNSQRSYPLVERASKTDNTNTVRIPDSFIVALYLPIHADLDIQVDQFYIKTLVISPVGYSVGVGYYNNTTGTSTLIANANIVAATHKPNTAYALAGIDDFADTVGQIVIGNLAEINGLPAGLYEFSFASGELESDAVRPYIRGISAIRVVNGLESSPLLYGDIELVAGANSRIDFSINSGSGNPRITFNAISSLDLNATCDCNTPNTGECIRCINGVCSGDGTFTIGGSSCITAETNSTGIALTDICATPCCGCAELDAIKLQIDRFSDGVSTLQNFVTRLNSEVTQMSLVVLGSRLGDGGCNTCG
jgi:hypothetical protein